MKHLLFYPFFDSSLCLNRSGILQMRNTTAGRASYGGFPGQLLFHGKEEFAENALQAAGSSMAADLCIWKPDDTGREETGTDRQYDGKKGVRLCLYKCRGSEVEKGPAWAGQARVCRGKHERDSPYPLHA